MSSLLPISEKEEEDVDIVPSYDKVSDRSSYYEKVNGPNPVYQQYNRKGLDSIPINMMEPKQHHMETVENALYDAVGVTDLEEEPVTVPITKSSTDAANDVTPVYTVPNKKSKTTTSITSGFLHTCEDADVVPVSSYLEIEDVDPNEHKAGADHDMSIFVSNSHIKLDNKADPGTEGDISASMDNDSDEVFTATAANMAPHQQVFRADSILSTTSDDRDLLNTNKKLKGRPKMSHPKSKHLGKGNAAAKNTPSPKPKRADLAKSQAPTADDKDSIKVLSENNITNMAAKQQKSEVARTESISSTTSDNRDLLDTDVKLKGHPKISHSVPKIFGNIAAAIKGTPSPKAKRAALTKFKSPTADVKVTQPVAKYTTTGGKAAQLVSKDTTANSKVMQLVAKDTKAAMDTTANSKVMQLVAKDTKAAMDTTADSKMAQLVAKGHVDKHDDEQVTSFTQTKPQQNFKLTVPHKPPIDQKFSQKASPKMKAHNAHHGNQPAASSPKLSKSKIAPTTGAYLNTSHPMQTNPLAQLRAKSSPRMKPRSINPAVQSKVIDNQLSQLGTKPADSTMATHQVTKQQLFIPEPTREIKRSSIATDKPVPNDAADKAAADEKRRHTVCNLSYKEKRDKEMDELDQSLKDLNDLISTI